jgi:hypothetical protein
LVSESRPPSSSKPTIGVPFRVRDGLVIALVAAGLVVYFTWPLAVRPASLGRVDTGDGRFSIWNVGWVAHALTRAERNVFDANIFRPHRGTLAYSEANLGAGVLGIPAYLATGSAVAAHNSAVLIGLWLSLIGAGLLAWRLTRSRTGAFVAAVLFTFCPHVFSHSAHIQLLMVFGLPWTLFALHAFVDAPSAARASLLGLALAVQALFSGYYGLFAGLAAGAGCLYYAWSRRLWARPRWWLLVGLAAAVSIAIVLPFFAPYARLQQETGFARSLDEAYRWSADWRAYFASSAWAHTWMLKYLGTWSEVLFPGFVAIALAGVGIATGLRRPAVAAGAVSPVPRVRETVGFYLLLAVLAGWTSFGPAAGLYTVLYETLPVFSLLRAPARFGIVLMLALAVLAACGAAALMNRAGRRRGLVAAALCAAAVLDLSTAWPAFEVPPPSTAHRTLRTLAPGTVVEFPFFYRPGDFHHHTQYMFDSTYHWLPLINGYSDYIPPDFIDMAVPLSSFPNPEGFQILRERRARYVLFRPERYNHEMRTALVARLEQYRPFLRAVVTRGDVWLYQIVAWPE